MSRVLVTGGAGFIGSHLVEKLVELGHNVTVIDQLSSGNIKNIESVMRKINFVEGDVLDLKLLEPRPHHYSLRPNQPPLVSSYKE